MWKKIKHIGIYYLLLGAIVLVLLFIAFAPKIWVDTIAILLIAFVLLIGIPFCIFMGWM